MSLHSGWGPLRGTSLITPDGDRPRTHLTPLLDSQLCPVRVPRTVPTVGRDEMGSLLAWKRPIPSPVRTQRGFGLGEKVTTADFGKNFLTDGARTGRPRKYTSWCWESLGEGGHKGDSCPGWGLGLDDPSRPFRVWQPVVLWGWAKGFSQAPLWLYIPDEFV